MQDRNCGCRSPMGSTRLQYSRALMLWLFTSFRTRTQMKPTVEQNTICQSVSVMGKGKPLKASTHLLKRMTAHETDIHRRT